MKEYTLHLGILPEVNNDEEYQTVIAFLKLLKEKFDRVYYILPRNDIKKLGRYKEDFLKELENLGIKMYQGKENIRNYIFKEENEENSLESFLGDDKRFREFAILYLKYRISKSISDLDSYNKTKQRITKTTNQENNQKSVAEGTYEKKKILFIHLDFANFFPRRKHTWYDLKMWAEFINTLISIVKTKLNHIGEHRVIAYLEDFFNPRSDNDMKHLNKFISEVFDDELFETIKDKSDYVMNFVAFLKGILGFEIEISPKEAEQSIPDKIASLKKEYPDSLHVILSDDKARDTTECDLRVIHKSQNKDRVLKRGKAKEVISIEEFIANPFILWFFTGIAESEESKKMTVEYTEENLKVEIEDFPLYSHTDQTMFILKLLSFYNKKPEEFRNFWLNLDFDVKDSFLRALKDYLNPTLKAKILLTLFEVDDSKKSEIINLLKNIIPDDVYEIMMQKYDEEKLEAELDWLRKKYKNKIELKNKIDNLNKEIAEINKIAKDENINEERKNNLEFEVKQLRKRYEELKKAIQKHEIDKSNLEKNIDRLEHRKIQLINERENLIKRKEELEREERKIEEEIENIEADLRVKNDQINELTNKKNMLAREYESKLSAKKNLDLDIKNLEEEKERIEKEINRLNNEKEKLDKEISEKRQEAEYIEKEVRERKEELEEYYKIKEDYEKLCKKKEMEQYIKENKSELKDITETLKELEAEYIKLKSEKDKVSQSCNKLKNQITELEKEVEKLNKNEMELQKAKESLEIKIKELNNLKKDLEKRKISLQQYEKIHKERSEEIKDFIRKIDSYINELPA